MKKTLLIVLMTFSMLFVLSSCKDDNKDNGSERICTFSIYLDVDATDEDVKRIEDEIRNFPGIYDYEFLDKDKAYEEIASEIGIDDEYLTEIDNPLPHSFLVKFKRKHFDESVQKYFENLDGVQEVKY